MNDADVTITTREASWGAAKELRARNEVEHDLQSIASILLLARLDWQFAKIN